MNNENNSLREFGKCRLDIEKRFLWCDDKPVPLPLKSMELLCLLVERGGEVVTKDEIWNAVWRDAFVEETNLTHNIYLLRKTLKDLGENDLIQTVPRRGYRFAGDVREITNGEIVIEKHTRTRTLIEIEEAAAVGEKSSPETETGQRVFTPVRNRTAVSLAAILILLGGVFAFSSYRGKIFGASASTIRSIAVLPFKTIDASPETDQQGLSLTDILITRLSNIREITVRPTNAILNFENADSIIAGQKLNTDAVLEGAIYRTGDKVRVTARLIKVADGKTIWNGQFEKLKTDELRLQDEIALAVTDALRLNLSDREKIAVSKRLTENADAFELYQKGRYEWNKRNWAGMVNAEKMFRGAIEKDPNFALAYAGLADTIMMNSEVQEAEDAINKALELDPNLAEAYASRGFLQTFHGWNWSAAEASFKKSIELNPNYATAHHWYAQVLTVQGRHEEAKAEMRRALEINPLSHNLLADLGQIYYFNREYREAEQYCRKALEIYPEFTFAHEYLMAVYLQTGRNDEAVEELITSSLALGTFENQSAERQKGLENDYADTRKRFAEGGIEKLITGKLTQPTPQDASMAYYHARYFALINEKERALERLEQAFAGHGFATLFIKADPVFDRLRDEPRYREILKKMNLE
jgi:DNA-binding winged helix-turn-helix (wHTH) protein/TolB-like protein/Tfp pilus assembly protein PilF